MILLVIIMVLSGISYVDSLSSSPSKKVLRVCQSPGCIADGAKETLGMCLR